MGQGRLDWETVLAGAATAMNAADRLLGAGKAMAGGALWFVLGATVPAADPLVGVAPQAAALAGPFAAGPHLAMGLPVGPGAMDPRESAEGKLALALNAAVPLARGPLVPALPFFPSAQAQDLARAVDCLAAAQYYEAGRGASDQRAVAQVVLNRVRHRAFPATVCGVVFQGAERSTGCQFTFTCDGALARRDPSAEAWEEALRTAAAMLQGQVEPTVGLATHYHTDWVSPAWDRSMDKIAAVRTHLFYRWRGWQTFDKPYPGSEPRIPALARLSAFHRDLPGGAGAGSSPPPETVVPAPAPSPMPAASLSLAKPVTATAGVFLATLPPGAGAESFPALAERRCAGLADCRFIGWTDSARTPRALPMPGSSVDTIAFVFTRRRGAETLRWDCTAFARADPGECIRRGT